MGDDSSNDISQEKISREERLAAKLRENLRRRKAQARQKGAGQADTGESGVPNGPKGS